MKKLIAFSSVCLSGLLLGSCATSGAVADNDVYMQQPTASTLFEDETDPTSFANFKAQEREDIIVTQNSFTPFSRNINVFNNFGFMGSPFMVYPYYGTMYLIPYYQNGFYQGVTYGHMYGMYGNPFYTPYPWINQHQVFIGPNFYYGYGQYSNGFGGNVASHNTNHYYQHRTTPTVGAPRNSNYPSTLKNKQVASVNNTPRTPGKIERNNNSTPERTVRRNIGTEYQLGNAKPTRTESVGVGSSTKRPSGQASYAGNVPSKQPTRTYSSPKSSSSSRTTQPINGSSRRSSGSTSSGRSTTIGTPSNGGGVRISSPSSSPRTAPRTISSGSSSRSSGTSSGSSSRSSSGGTSTTSRRR
ncbi:hypothetical protein [Lishizhenia tianjinensis]|nr:hypothetical protein [Lishizhenia tianjinensis]